MDDCDCREMSLPSESLKLFEQINGINIPKKNLIKGRKPEVVRIEKPEQTDKVILTVNGDQVYADSIMLRSFWGNKRKRVTIEFPSINISLVYEKNAITATLSFAKKHSVKSTLKDLSVLALWNAGSPLVFSHKVDGQLKPVLQIPSVKGTPVCIETTSFINENLEFYQLILKTEEYLGEEFSIPDTLSENDRNAVIKVLSAFEEVEVGDILNLNLSLKCDPQLYELLSVPSKQSIGVIESDEEQVCLFGHKYVIKEQKISIISPVIENVEEVKTALSQGKEAIAKIVSSTGSKIMRCKL